MRRNMRTVSSTFTTTAASRPSTLIIFGLCSETDPVATLFKNRWLMYFGAISYAQYVMQSVVFYLVEAAWKAAYTKDSWYVGNAGDDPWPYAPKTPKDIDPGAYVGPKQGVWQFQIVLPATLFATAYLTHYFVSVPCGAHLRKKLDTYCASLDHKPAT